MSSPPASSCVYICPNRLQKSPSTRWPSQRSTPTPKFKPLSRKIDPWIWSSFVLSLASLLFLRLINYYTPLYNSRAHINGQKLDGSGRAGEAELLGSGSGFEALLVVIIFYDTILLILSSKVQRLAQGTSRLQMQFKVESKSEGDDLEVDVDVADLRGCMVFWILAISQSGLAAFGMYGVVRLVWMIGRLEKGGVPVVECFELLCVLGVMGMMVYIGVCCIVLDSARCSSKLEVEINEC